VTKALAELTSPQLAQELAHDQPRLKAWSDAMLCVIKENPGGDHAIEQEYTCWWEMMYMRLFSTEKGPPHSGYDLHSP
jgi:hypothetical protein